jgi:hypothetical protein
MIKNVINLIHEKHWRGDVSWLLSQEQIEIK